MQTNLALFVDFKKVLIALILTIGTIVFLHHGFFDYYTVPNDTFYEFPFLKYTEPDSFSEDDLIITYIEEKTNLPFEFIFAPIAILFGAAFYNKILMLITYFVTAYLLLFLGEIVSKDKNYALFLTVIFLIYTKVPVHLTGSIPALFGIGMLSLFSIFILKDNWKGALFCILLSGLLIPYLVPVLFLAFLIFSQTNKKYGFKFDKIKLFWLIVVTLISLSFTVSLFLYSTEIGAPYSLKEYASMPEFQINQQMGGGYSIFFVPPQAVLFTLLNLVGPLSGELQEDTNFFALLTLISTPFFIFILRKKIFKLPKIFWILLISAIIIFFFVYFSFFFAPLKLYFPFPYSSPVISFFSLLFFSFSFWQIIQKINFKLKVSIIALFLILFFVYSYNIPPEYVCNDFSLYEFSQNSKEGSVFAGHPEDMDCMSLFGKRSVFIADIFSEARYKNYWEEMKRRNFVFFDFYYSNDIRKVKDFCKNEKVDYIVVNLKLFEKIYMMNWKYFDPLEDFVKNKYLHSRGKFVLLDLAKNKGVLLDNEMFVLSCDKLD